MRFGAEALPAQVPPRGHLVLVHSSRGAFQETEAILEAHLDGVFWEGSLTALLAASGMLPGT